jgi:hypothetical protein
MRRLYFIVPVIGLGFFGGAYWQFSERSAEAARVRAGELAATRVNEQARLAAAEVKAKSEADQRTLTRLADEEKKQAALHVQWEADSAQIATETIRYQAQIGALRTEVAEVERQLAEARKTKVSEAARAFELAREVELARIAKRNAELELQRTTEILARRAGQTTWPPPSP